MRKKRELSLSLRSWAAWLPTIIWALMIFWFSTMPAPEAPSIELPFFDKISHFIAYNILAILLMRSLRMKDIRDSLTPQLFTLILATGYGILMELIQRFVPTRNFELYDIAANISGVICGILLVRLVSWHK